jgi:hypothetical protein
MLRGVTLDEEATWSGVLRDDSIFVNGTGKSPIFRAIDEVRSAGIAHEALFEDALLPRERVSRMALGLGWSVPEAYGTQRAHQERRSVVVNEAAYLEALTSQEMASTVIVGTNGVRFGRA